MKRFAQFAIAFAVSGCILYALFGQFDPAETMASVWQARPSLLMLGIMFMIAAYLFRGARWRIWERSLSYWDSLRLILIGFMGNNVLPARLGEILRAHCTAVKTSRDRGRTTALASIGAERILDGLVLALFGLVGIALIPVDRRLSLGLFLVSFTFAGFFLAVVFSIRFHDRIRGLLGTAGRKFPGHMTRFLLEKSNQFLDGLLPLGTWPTMMSGFAATAVIWGIEALACYLIGLAVWDGMTMSAAVLFLVVVNFVSLVPFTLGGIGAVEAVAPAFLISAGISPYPALAMVLLQHASQYLIITIAGAILYFAGGFYRIPLAAPKASITPSAGAALESSIVDQTRSSLAKLMNTVELRPAPQHDVQVSIVIPAYNEQARLPETVLELIQWCTASQLDFEVIIVDDGSRDRTLALGRLFEDSDVRIRALACPHMGKGAAVRLGMLNSRGRFAMFMDADGATPLNEIPKLLQAVAAGSDVAIGSRVVQSPGEVEVKTSRLRRVMGRMFALLVNLAALSGIADTQCGFKMFRREVVAPIFSRQRIAGFAFDVEILFIARNLSLSVAEIPVNWIAQPGSKINLVTDSIKMLWDVSRIRWLHRNFEPDASPNEESTWSRTGLPAAWSERSK